jgi:acyl-CoA reductase-like NAD-dependent aldehyde dehydrogenase
MATNSSASGFSLDFTSFHNIINGQLSGTAKTRRTINPSTLEENPEVPVSTREDVDKAVEAARHAAESWAEVSLEERRRLVLGFADALESVVEEFVEMNVKEMGKPVSTSRWA